MFNSTRFGVSGLILVALGMCVIEPATARAQSVEWTQRVATGPSARHTSAMAYDSARGVTVLFGGFETNAGYNGDTWEWDGTTWTQRMVIGPSPRSIHAMAYDSARAVTVLFGGFSNTNGPSDETWEWNGTTWAQRMVTGPSPRYDHKLVYDSARSVTVLFGGRINPSGIFNSGNDTWEWDGTTWTQRAVAGPSARRDYGMAYDVARGVTVLYGGAAPTSNNQTWEWNGTAWTQRVVSGPGTLVSHSMVYDSARGVAALYGGQSASGGDDTWEWNGSAWTQLPISGPGQRFFHSMAFDTARGVTVFFGGRSSAQVFHGDTWELGVTGCPGRKGDFDNDNVVTPSDIPDFINNLLNGPADATAACKTDMNADTLSDAGDIATFVGCLTGGACP